MKRLATLFVALLALPCLAADDSALAARGSKAASRQRVK